MKPRRNENSFLIANEIFQQKECDALDQSAGSIQGRVQRVHDVVMADMDNYEPDWYTDKVREEASKLLKGMICSLDEIVRRITSDKPNIA